MEKHCRSANIELETFHNVWLKYHLKHCINSELLKLHTAEFKQGTEQSDRQTERQMDGRTHTQTDGLPSVMKRATGRAKKLQM